LAKRAFQLHGTDNHGRAVVSRRVSGGKLVETIVQLAPEVVAMKTSCGATVGGRRFPELGIEVRLIHAKFIRPGVKSAKNYALDAAAICEAVQRPHMRFVPIKSIEQQDIQALHRAREQVMRWRTALINHIRGLLLQYGVAVPQGPARFRQEVTLTLDDPSTEPPPLAFELFRRLMSQLRALEDWLTISIGASSRCAGITSCIDGSPPCLESGRSLPPLWSAASATRASSVAIGTSRPRSGWCLDSTRVAASPSSWASAVAATTTCASS
jgi:hypothetical protein